MEPVPVKRTNALILLVPRFFFRPLKEMSDSTDLATLFSMYGSDKDRNGYSSLYNALFLHLRASPVTL